MSVIHNINVISLIDGRFIDLNPRDLGSVSILGANKSEQDLLYEHTLTIKHTWQ